MATIEKIIREEIRIIVQKEIKQALHGVEKKVNRLSRKIDMLQQRSSGSKPHHSGSKGNHRQSSTEYPAVTGEAIKRLRKKAGISQSELAELTGVSFQIVSVWEHKKGALNMRNKKAAEKVQQLLAMKKDDIQKLLEKSDNGTRRENKPGQQQKKNNSKITGSKIKQVRKNLGLTQTQFARLAGVSNQIVSVWEQKQGALSFRGNTEQQLLSIMNMSKQQAGQQLARL